MEDQPEMSSAVTTPVKVGILRKSAVRVQNKMTIYKVHGFFKHICKQPECFCNTYAYIK
jgi:hypothetical protein